MIFDLLVELFAFQVFQNHIYGVVSLVDLLQAGNVGVVNTSHDAYLVF